MKGRQAKDADGIWGEKRIKNNRWPAPGGNMRFVAQNLLFGSTFWQEDGL